MLRQNKKIFQIQIKVNQFQNSKSSEVESASRSKQKEYANRPEWKLSLTWFWSHGAVRQATSPTLIAAS